MAGIVDDAVWNKEDWKWDPHAMKATPAEGGAAPSKAPKGSDTKQGCQVRAAAALLLPPAAGVM